MRLKVIVLFCLAIFFGGVSVFIARGWLESQRSAIAAQAKTTPVATLVVAAKPLRFGDRLERSSLKEIPWPTKQLPAGSFGKRNDLLAGGVRHVTSAIETDEPIFGYKITGSGQRATLSAVLADDKKAITIRVNDVLGVAGFVLPGDRVDILLARNVRSGFSDDQTTNFVDVLLQGVRVLAIDQIADERRDKPAVAKAVTLEVSTQEAQKLTLAASVGQLSLALRNSASGTSEQTQRVTLHDLSRGSVASGLTAKRDDAAEAEVAPAAVTTPAITAQPRPPVVVGVWRALKRTEYRMRDGGSVGLDEQSNDNAVE